MDRLLIKYKQLIDTYSREYIIDETRRFPEHYSFEEKVKLEYMSIHGYVNDKNSNEAFFDSNQLVVIEETLEELDNSLNGEHIDETGDNPIKNL